MRANIGRVFLAYCVAVFGKTAENRDERVLRFVEEALELAQAACLPLGTVERLLARTYSRPRGEVTKELAQCGLTLALVTEVLGRDLEGLVEDEATRCMGVTTEEWHRRHATKVALGLGIEHGAGGPQEPAPEYDEEREAARKIIADAELREEQARDP